MVFNDASLDSIDATMSSPIARERNKENRIWQPLLRLYKQVQQLPDLPKKIDLGVMIANNNITCDTKGEEMQATSNG